MSGKTITSIRIKDFGEFHNTLAKCYIQVESEEEKVYISYGFGSQLFLPSTIIQNGNKIFLQKAGVGKLGDIKLTAKEWLMALTAMRSRSLLAFWKEKLINKQVA